jgi:hypothetical protein
MPGIEPGAFHMQSERSTTELHPLMYKFILFQFISITLFCTCTVFSQFKSVVSCSMLPNTVYLGLKCILYDHPVMGKHPDLMVAHPTSTIFLTIGRNFEIS